MQETFNLKMEPKAGLTGMRTFELSTTVTSTTSSRGTAGSSIYGLQPAIWTKKAMDAAKERMRFMQVVGQATLGEGAKDYFWAKRKKYLADASWETSSAEYAASTEIAWTEINTADAVQFTPTYYNYGVAIAPKNIVTNALDLIAYAREELSYKYENAVDSAVRDALLGACGSGTPQTEPTPMSNSVNGVQTIFGGDATDAASNLDAGDVITTDMVAKAKRMLNSTGGYYWTGNTLTKSAVTKNSWYGDDGEPFVLFIAPEQEEAFLKDSQFTNAAEYGSNNVVMRGEIGDYLGIKVISTSKVPAFDSSGDYVRVQGTDVAMDVNGHVCGLVKAGKCGGLVWGRSANVQVFDYPVADQIRMKLSLAYAASGIHTDAIVRMVVSDA